jgi:tetratricopeptide (TPR) repeat protein
MSSGFEDDKNPKSVPDTVENTRTQIDLGDDLIEKTAFIPGHKLAEEIPVSSSPALEETIQNARILLNEGFSEEAKQILRQLLLRDRNNLDAQKLLEEIHASELKQMFAPGERAARKSFVNRGIDESALRVDSDQILRALDQEFDLGMGFGGGRPKSVTVFNKLELEVAGVGATARDRLDLAISFLEMDLYTHATQLLKSVIRSGEYPEIAISLLAYCHLMNEEPYETIEVLQPYLNDMDIVERDKVEFYYLMARANQSLGKKPEALGWYRQTTQVEANYRDCEERIKQLMGRR